MSRSNITQKKVKSQFSQNLRLLRKYLGFSQQKLATELGLKRNQIAAYEASISEPNVQQLTQLAVFFLLSPTDLWQAPLEQIFATDRVYVLHRKLNQFHQATETAQQALTALNNLQSLKSANQSEQELAEVLEQLVLSNQKFMLSLG